MDLTPTKLLLVCNNEIGRTLLTLRLQKNKNIQLVGSCMYDSTMDRFLKIYNPDIVLIYDMDFKKKKVYQCIQFLRKNYSSKIAVLSPTMKDYELKLFFRYGANSVTDGECDLGIFLRDTKSLWNKTQYPMVHAHKLGIVHDHTINKYQRGDVENMVAYDYRLLQRSSNTYILSNRGVFSNFSRLCKQEMLEHILKLKSNRELPESPTDLVDYVHLFPETFYPLKSKLDKKQRFMFFISSAQMRYVERLRHKKMNEVKNTEFRGYKYSEDDTDLFLKRNK